MNFSKENFVTPDQILADVLKFVDDEDFRLNTRGFYVSQMQQALQELAYDTFFDERTQAFDVPADLKLEMPEGAFNIRQMYLFNGTKCNIKTAQNVYWSRNYITDGKGFVKRDRGNLNRNDPFYAPRERTRDKHLDDALDGAPFNNSRQITSGGSNVSQLFFYGIQSGLIMLSPSCTKFEKILIVFNGTGGKIGDIPCIPQYLREAVKHFVIDVALLIAMAKREDVNRWIRLQQLNERKLKGTRREEEGSWYKAEYRVKSMDSKAQEDLKEYLSRLDY